MMLFYLPQLQEVIIVFSLCTIISHRGDIHFHRFLFYGDYEQTKNIMIDLLPPHIESKTNIRRLGYYFQRHICKLKPCRSIYRFHAYLKFPYLINSVDLCSIQEKQSQHSKRQLKTGLKRER